MVTAFSSPPAQPTRLLGRVAELETIVGLLAGRTTRLLTLTGPPGVGKTRLALEAANQTSAAFPDGVTFVDLTPVRDPGLVLLKIAERFGIAGKAAPSLLKRLGESPQERLLVLDNFEQVLPAARELAELLASAPGFTMLVTTRIPLQLQWEQIVRIAPLEIPKPGSPLPLAELERLPSVALFLERARARQAGFELTEDRAPLVAQLVAQLDGLPLAIELAAARMDVLPLEVIAGWLADRLSLLQWDAADRPMKHRSLEAAIGWSYDLLPESEQRFLRHLGVFVGHVSLHAAEDVAGLEDERATLPVVASLAERSLILPSDEKDGEPSFGMLETVREYAWEQLERHGELEKAREAHARYFIELAERAKPELTTRRQRIWYRRLEREHDNLRVALRYLLDRGDQDASLRLAGALGWFWITRGYHTEGRQWLEETLNSTPSADTVVRTQALLIAGLILTQVDLGRSQTMLEEAISLARARGDRRAIAEALTYLGIRSVVAGDMPAAAPILDEALRCWQKLAGPGTDFQIGLTLRFLAVVAFARDNTEVAASLLSDALDRYEKCGDTRTANSTRFYLALTVGRLGDLCRAVQLVREGLHAARMFEDRLLLFLGVEATLVLAGDQAEPEQRARLLGASSTLSEMLGDHPGYLARSLGQGFPGVDEQLPTPESRQAYQQGRYLPFAEIGDLTEALLADLSHNRSSRVNGAAEQTQVSPMTERQQEVLQLVAEGLTSRQIGKQLFLSPRTVDHHVDSIFARLGVDTRAQAVAVATRDGLLADR